MREREKLGVINGNDALVYYRARRCIMEMLYPSSWRSEMIHFAHNSVHFSISLSLSFASAAAVCISICSGE